MKPVHHARCAVLLAMLALAGVVAPLAVPAASRDVDGAVATLVDGQLSSLVSYYVALHASPELSHHEEHTAAGLAAELRDAGYEVTEHLGHYASGDFTGYGVVGVLRNGSGPVVLVRADMDALPVAEATSLPYASQRRAISDAGSEVPVMHACGHDIHVTALIGLARVMARLRSRWHGTLVLLGQPAEETIDGALALVRDRLYERVPRPDFVLALHDTADLPTGTIGLTPGYALATSTQVDVVVRGVGGHGSRPEQAKDPVVLAANIVMQLQTIVSREISPFDQAVVTVGTIHGGTKRNIIPDEVKLELNLRAYKDDVRRHLIESVARIARAAALGAGMPEDRLPLVRVVDTEFAPALYNDPALSARLRAPLERALGKVNVRDKAPIMGSEDVGYLDLDGKIPLHLFWVGASTPEALAAAAATGSSVPGLHSSRFAPVPGPTLRTGVVAMSTAVLELLGR